VASPVTATIVGGETSRAADAGSEVTNLLARKRTAAAPRAWWQRPGVLAGGAGGVAVLCLLAAVAFWLTRPSAPPPSSEPGHDAPRAQDSGFVPLFNGRDLTGWKPHPVGKARWDVQDGVLTGSGNTGHLFFEASSYENFRLRVEAMINDGGNSGVFFRTPFGPANAAGYPTGGYEAQINSTHRDPHRTGSLYVGSAVAVSVPNAPVKPGEWFTLEVLADGPHVVLTVNGETTAEYVDAAPHARVGQVALQVLDANTVVKFRKVEIRELPPGDLRLQWVHSRGRFDQVKDRVWFEYFDDRRMFWREIHRDERVVRLQAADLSERWVDLHQDGFVYAKSGKDGQWTRGQSGAWKVRERLPAREKSAAARVGEWVPLFNGKDLTGWDAAGEDTVSWSWQDGALVGRVTGSRPGVLISQRADYDHFHLHMELMLGKKHRGYLVLRGGPPGEGQGYAVRLAAAQDVPLTTGTLVLAAPRTPEALLSAAPTIPRNPGDWFPLDVIAEGNRLRVLLDGRTAVDHVDVNDTFPVGRLALYCAPDAIVRVRNLTIKELPPPAGSPPAVGSGADDRDFVPLFNGKDLAGWQSFPRTPNHWDAKNGILTCRTGPPSVLLTERDDYQDFHLRVEAKINGAGNSGLLFWCETGPRDAPGFESDIYPGATTDQTGSLWEWTPALRHLARAGERLMAPDRWFTHEVITQGNRVKVLVNGKTAVDATLWSKTRARGRLGLQHLDAKTVVEFRKVEVKDLTPR
jgi:hypothetical protein